MRIALRNILGLSDREETSQDITNTADVSIQQVYTYLNALFTKRHGIPAYISEDNKTRECQFMIAGIGRLGGKDLHFDSPLEMLFVYTANGETEKSGTNDRLLKDSISNKEFYFRLSSKILSILDRDGVPFCSNPFYICCHGNRLLSCSLLDIERYLEAQGSWSDRETLLSSRFIAGDEELYEVFSDLIEPFLFRKSLNWDDLDEIRGLKNRDVHNEDLQAIQNASYIVRAIQLIYGGNDHRIRKRGFRDGLTAAINRGYLKSPEMTSSVDFMLNLQQKIGIIQPGTCSLPEEGERQSLLSELMGSHIGIDKTLPMIYDYHNNIIEKVFNDFLPPGEDEIERNTAFQSHLLYRDASPIPSDRFQNLRQFNTNMASIRDCLMSSLSFHKKNVPALTSNIIKHCSLTLDPDLSLNNFERFISSGRDRKVSFLFLFERETLSEILSAIFSVSEYLSNILIAHPELIDTPFFLEILTGEKGKDALFAELTDLLNLERGHHYVMERIIQFKMIEELRIGIRCICVKSKAAMPMQDLSDLADVCLAKILEWNMKILKEKYGAPLHQENGSLRECGFAMIGLGKYGGSE